MPSQFDTTYHQTFRKNTFDDEPSKRLYQLSKEADEVLEVRPPPVPTPEMEVEYIDWLQEDFKSDPWITYRFRKFTANPKRIPWKNTRRLKRQYQFTYCVNWLIGSVLFWPVAAFIGRRFKTTRGGVPVVRINRWVHDFPKPEPGLVARSQFRYYAFGSSLIMGWFFARTVTDSKMFCSNEWYNRPDLKPYQAMVKPADDLTWSTMLESQYINRQQSGWKSSPIYRYFMARDADFTIKANPYEKLHPEDVWDPRVGRFSTYTNRFGEHHQ